MKPQPSLKKSPLKAPAERVVEDIRRQTRCPSASRTMSHWPLSLSMTVEIVRDHTRNFVSRPTSIKPILHVQGGASIPLEDRSLGLRDSSDQLAGPTPKVGNRGHTVRDRSPWTSWWTLSTGLTDQEVYLVCMRAYAAFYGFMEFDRTKKIALKTAFGGSVQFPIAMLDTFPPVVRAWEHMLDLLGEITRSFSPAFLDIRWKFSRRSQPPVWHSPVSHFSVSYRKILLFCRTGVS